MILYYQFDTKHIQKITNCVIKYRVSNIYFVTTRD